MRKKTLGSKVTGAALTSVSPGTLTYVRRYERNETKNGISEMGFCLAFIALSLECDFAAVAFLGIAFGVPCLFA
jgi:hypothetical protein